MYQALGLVPNIASKEAVSKQECQQMNEQTQAQQHLKVKSKHPFLVGSFSALVPSASHMLCGPRDSPKGLLEALPPQSLCPSEPGKLFLT